MSRKKRRNPWAGQNNGLASQARTVCKGNGLFLLVEAQTRPLPQERWALLCEQTGMQVATYYPRSRNVLLSGAEGARRCRDWQEAVALAAERRAVFAARSMELSDATR